MTRGIKEEFPLPSPPKKKEKHYIPIPRITHQVPYGYKEDPDNPDIFVPIKSELDNLEKAKDFLKKYSYRAVAYWLSEETGREISAMGLKKRVDRERRYKSAHSIHEFYAKEYKKAMEKAEKWAKKLGQDGTYEWKYPSDDSGDT